MGVDEMQQSVTVEGGLAMCDVTLINLHKEKISGSYSRMSEEIIFKNALS